MKFNYSDSESNNFKITRENSLFKCISKTKAITMRFKTCVC